jgi:hypothetical protein
MEDKFYVYIIGAKPNGPIKIGFSTNYAKRLSSLQHACHLELYVIKKWSLTWENAVNLERAAHKELTEYREREEWFNCSPNDAVLAIQDIINKTKKCRDWSVYATSIKKPLWVNGGNPGLRKSAATRKAATAAKLALIENDLKRNEHTTRELLDRVGIRSINTIKNHYGITREQMQRRYKAAQKRREARV